MADGVTQLLSTKNLKEIVGKDWLVRSKLLEELSSLSFSVEAHKSNSSPQNYLISPFSIASGAIYRGSRGERAP